MAENNDYKIIKRNGNLVLLQMSGVYAFVDFDKGEDGIITTPGGDLLRTSYYELAVKLFDDLVKYGIDNMSASSIVPWHFTMVQNFLKMTHKEVEDMLISCFLQKHDWTFDKYDDLWFSAFGEKDTRNKKIKEWLSKCTHMQMTAACCIGNAYDSINLSYVLAVLVESYSGAELRKQMKQLAQMINDNYGVAPINDIINDFNNFNLYYGIHFKEHGPTLDGEHINLIKEDEDKDINVTEELLIGRNYIHYVDGIIQDDESESMNECAESIIGEDLEGEYDLYSVLPDFLPDDCWIKRIRGENEQYANYLIALEVEDNKVIRVNTFLDVVQRMGSSIFYIPGFSAETHYYEEIDNYECDTLDNELKMLKKGRYLDKNSSFIHKKISKQIFEHFKHNNSDTEFLLSLQSLHRFAYMNVIIETDEDGNISHIDYTPYSSSGDAFNDMFSRPQYDDNIREEVIDVMLYVIDSYTDEEYKNMNMNK